MKCFVCTVDSHHYNTAGIREMDRNSQYRYDTYNTGVYGSIPSAGTW